MAVRGNLVVGQSGGPTAVINNSLVGVIHEAMAHAEIDDIFGMVHGIRGVLNAEFMDLRKESPQTLELLRNTPASALGTVRYKVTEEDYPRLIEVFKRFNVRYFFYIGGNDSMDTSHKIHLAAEKLGYEMYAIGVPKTIDNDLAETDHCPGYGSAARFVAAGLRNTGLDTWSMGDSGPIKLVEVMGRNAGWLAAATALAREREGDPPHLIYVPERGVTLEQIVADVQNCYEKYGFCVAAVSEGLTGPDGEELARSNGKPVEVDAFGHARKSGVVDVIADAIKEHLGFTARFDKPGYMQRSFAELMSPVDREEAYEVGRAAVRAALAGVSNKMVTLVREPGDEYRCTTGLAPLEKVANREHMLPSDMIAPSGNDVTEEFIKYARPLIGGPLVSYGRLERHLVSERVH
ncbi:MAG TPA: 6-phosphofructokinase [Chloroflexi bacterium]|jgi:6-phosphofructokinase|nr:6-phosphofructokinase [Chloroflexota bacterium]